MKTVFRDDTALMLRCLQRFPLPDPCVAGRTSARFVIAGTWLHDAIDRGNCRGTQHPVAIGGDASEAQPHCLMMMGRWRVRLRYLAGRLSWLVQAIFSLWLDHDDSSMRIPKSSHMLNNKGRQEANLRLQRVVTKQS